MYKKANTNSLLDHAAIQCTQYVNTQIVAHDKTALFGFSTKKKILNKKTEYSRFSGPRNPENQKIPDNL